MSGEREREWKVVASREKGFRVSDFNTVFGMRERLQRNALFLTFGWDVI